MFQALATVIICLSEYVSAVFPAFFCQMHAKDDSRQENIIDRLSVEVAGLKLTEDCERKNHILHDFITQTGAHTLGCVHFGLQVALVHPDLHLLLHFVGTESSEEGSRAGINY